VAMTNRAAPIGRGLVAALAVGLLVAGCQSDPIAPPEVTPDVSGSGRQGSGAGAPSTSSGSTPAPAGQGIDVCALVPPDVVRSLLGVDQVAEVPDAAPTPTTSPPPGAPALPAAYRCTYEWTAGRLVLSVLPDSGADTAQGAVDTVLGTPSTALPGVGDAAAVDRSGRLGNGFAFLAAAKQSDTKVGAVLVRAPTQTPDDKLATLAQQLLAAL
jgi:hypothetical protein